MQKNFPKIFLFFLFSSAFLSFGFFASAANPKPADCVSITNFYPRAPDDVTYYSFGNPIELFYGYKPYFRGFIPPGTVMLDLLIIENGKQMAVVHHKTPPTGLPQFPPANYTNRSAFKLSELEGREDQWATEQQGFLQVISDSFLSLEISRAGWVYVKVGGGIYSSNYSTQFSARVDTKTYNAWWDKYIKDEAGWNKYIESVETYVDPTIASPTPTLTPTPTFLLGDLNQDRTVNLFDYNLFLPEFGNTNPGNIADLNKNGKVDIFDYNILLGNFGKSG